MVRPRRPYRSGPPETAKILRDPSPQCQDEKGACGKHSMAPNHGLCTFPPATPPHPEAPAPPPALAEKSKTGDTSSHMGLPTNTTSCVSLSFTPSSLTASLIAGAQSRRAEAGLESMSSGWHLHRQTLPLTDIWSCQTYSTSRFNEQCCRRHELSKPLSLSIVGEGVEWVRVLLLRKVRELRMAGDRSP